MKKVIIICGTVIVLIFLSIIFFDNKASTKSNNSSLVDNTNGMISYTIDGEMAKEKPTKENGYIVNKIECKNGSVLVWDNDNWQVELVDIKSDDRCTVDFTKDKSKSGYRVTVTSNGVNKLDSTSKTTTNGGTVTIYPKGGTILSVTGCNGVLEDNKVIVRNVVENQTCNINIAKTLADIVLEKYSDIVSRTDFSKAETSTNLWKTTDYDINGNFTGTSYYFTGNPDNWVEFAGKLWRIIRINGDGSIRLLYAGTGSKDGYIDTSSFNVNSDDPMYVGWKYGSSGSLENNRTNENESTIYLSVENWYKTNIVSKGLEKYISKTAVYCNDRSLGNGQTYKIDTNFSFNYRGANYYGSSAIPPTLECIDLNDQFKEGFGLMSVVEVIFAGGCTGCKTDNSYFILSADGNCAFNYGYFWTMSPVNWGNGYASVYSIDSNGFLNMFNLDGSIFQGRVRPVISINGIYSEGDGTSSKPYKIKIQ